MATKQKVKHKTLVVRYCIHCVTKECTVYEFISYIGNKIVDKKYQMFVQPTRKSKQWQPQKKLKKLVK